MIHTLLDFLRTLTTPERLIHLLSTVMSGWLGYAMLTGIVFAETGLLVGFVLPGDSLLFTIGVVAGAGQLNLAIMILLLILRLPAGRLVRLSAGAPRRSGDFQSTGFAFLQAGTPAAHPCVLREARRQDHHLRKVRAHHPHFRAVRGGRREDALSQFLSFDVFGAIGWVFSMTILGVLLGRIPLVRTTSRNSYCW